MDAAPYFLIFTGRLHPHASPTRAANRLVDLLQIPQGTARQIVSAGKAHTFDIQLSHAQAIQFQEALAQVGLEIRLDKLSFSGTHPAKNTTSPAFAEHSSLHGITPNEKKPAGPGITLLLIGSLAVLILAGIGIAASLLINSTARIDFSDFKAKKPAQQITEQRTPAKGDSRAIPTTPGQNNQSSISPDVASIPPQHHPATHTKEEPQDRSGYELSTVKDTRKPTSIPTDPVPPEDSEDLDLAFQLGPFTARYYLDETSANRGDQPKYSRINDKRNKQLKTKRVLHPLFNKDSLADYLDHLHANRVYVTWEARVYIPYAGYRFHTNFDAPQGQVNFWFDQNLVESWNNRSKSIALAPESGMHTITIEFYPRNSALNDFEVTVSKEAKIMKTALRDSPMNSTVPRNQANSSPIE